MTAALIVFTVLAWWGSGVTGFIYWWTSEFDLERHELVAAVFIGLLGPVAWLVGCWIHHGDKSNRVVMRRRQRRAS